MKKTLKLALLAGMLPSLNAIASECIIDERMCEATGGGNNGIPEEEGVRIDECEGHCVTSDHPPVAPFMYCSWNSPQLDCSVWPRGAGVTYRWESFWSSALSITGHTPFPYQSFNCSAVLGPISVSVTAIAPNGLSSRSDFDVACPSQGLTPKPDPDQA